MYISSLTSQPFDLYSSSPHSPQFQQSAGAMHPFLVSAQDWHGLETAVMLTFFGQN
jgi:hypothetical protein